jgi:NAD(P)-dependent dehydrogenase (short-subunit alcohol dehydrogenase family)
VARHRLQGRLDVLVNSVAGEDPMMHQWGLFWNTHLENGEAIFRQCVLSHIITSKHAAPLMIRAGRCLIVEVSENDTLFAGGNPLTQTVKLTIKGLALNMAPELLPHGVTAVSITPGFLRSESMLQRQGVTEENWRDAGKKDPNFLESESPLFVGRAIAAPASDPSSIECTGQLLGSWELARHYGFTDHDGRRPDRGALAIDWSLMPPASVDLFRTATRKQIDWLNTLARRTEQFMAKLPPVS